MDASQVVVACCRCVDKTQGVLSKTRRKLAASVVRQEGHLHDGRTDPQPRAGGKIGHGQVKLHKEIVAGSRERLTRDDQFYHVQAHDGNLRLRTARRAPVPLVSGQPLLGCEAHVGQREQAPDSPNDLILYCQFLHVALWLTHHVLHSGKAGLDGQPFCLTGAKLFYGKPFSPDDIRLRTPRRLPIRQRPLPSP